MRSPLFTSNSETLSVPLLVTLKVVAPAGRASLAGSQPASVRATSTVRGPEVPSPVPPSPSEPHAVNAMPKVRASSAGAAVRPERGALTEPPPVPAGGGPAPTGGAAAGASDRARAHTGRPAPRTGA